MLAYCVPIFHGHISELCVVGFLDIYIFKEGCLLQPKRCELKFRTGYLCLLHLFLLFLMFLLYSLFSRVLNGVLRVGTNHKIQFGVQFDTSENKLP